MAKATKRKAVNFTPFRVNRHTPNGGGHRKSLIPAARRTLTHRRATNLDSDPAPMSSFARFRNFRGILACAIGAALMVASSRGGDNPPRTDALGNTTLHQAALEND